MAGKNSSQSSDAFHILVLGGSYGGLSTIVNLLDVCGGSPTRHGNEVLIECEIPINITLIDERDGFFHLIGAPLALIDDQCASKFWIQYDEIPALRRHNVRVIHGSVQSVDHERMSASVTPHHDSMNPYKIDYDYLIAATGFRRAWPTVPQALSATSYLEEAHEHIKLVRSATNGIAVIGGGAVGIEMAAEIKDRYPDTEVALIHSRRYLLSAEPLPTDFGDRTFAALRDLNINVVLGKRVVEVIPGKNGTATSELVLSDGTSMHASHVIGALSRPVPTGTYLSADVLNEDREIEIQPTTQFSDRLVNSDCHFAVGDIAAWPPKSAPVVKRCGMAMFQGNIAARNIHRHILHRLDLVQDPQYQTLPVSEPVIALALGKSAIGYSRETGVTYGKELCDSMFGDDLGFTICRNHLGLGKED